MLSTATRAVREILTDDWEGVQAAHARHIELSTQQRLNKYEKEELPAVVKFICEKEYDRVASVSLRMDRFVHIPDNGKNVELDVVCQRAAARKSPIAHVAWADRTFDMQLASRMMVNHAGGVIENAGLCLHRFFNYPMIPGSAIKGVARHYAWEQWRAAHDGGDDTVATTIARRMLAVFGYPTNDDALDDFIKSHRLCAFDTKGRTVANAGTVCFLPAVPVDTNWQLVTDVLTPHGGNDHTNPIPSFFLAVKEGCAFRFALKAGPLTKSNELDWAETWLKDALQINGIGAKTAAGYGFFRSDAAQTVEAIKLTLTTPAFIGGASQRSSDDTRFRIPSLRGMLRWWWRTLYRGALSEAQVRELEGVIWGTTEQSSLIKLQAIPVNCSVEAFNYRNPQRSFELGSEFARDHGINPQGSGILYLAYGMDERDVHRHYIAPGASWQLRLTLRNNQAHYNIAGKEIPAERVREQAILALSLLTRYGGIGSKARRAYGSLSWTDALSREECIAQRDVFLGNLGLRVNGHNVPYSLESAITAAVSISTTDVWQAIDALGRAVQGFAASYKHKECKIALGLPRKIHGPYNDPIPRRQNPDTHRPPLQLGQGGQARFAGPVWYHLEPSNGRFTAHVIAFPSDMRTLTDLNTSTRMLTELVEYVQGNCQLSRYVAAAPRPGQPRQGGRPQPPQRPAGPQAGDNVEVKLLDERTARGGWKAEHATLGIGPIQNSAAVPDTVKVGDSVKVKIAIAKQGNPAFKWITS